MSLILALKYKTLTISDSGSRCVCTCFVLYCKESTEKTNQKEEIRQTKHWCIPPKLTTFERLISFGGMYKKTKNDIPHLKCVCSTDTQLDESVGKPRGQILLLGLKWLTRCEHLHSVVGHTLK